MDRGTFDELAYLDWKSKDGEKLLDSHGVSLETPPRVGPWNKGKLHWGGYSKKNITNKKNKGISKKTKKSKRSSKKKRKNNKTKHKRKNKTKRKNK